jgi:hypothetical protein
MELSSLVEDLREFEAVDVDAPNPLLDGCGEIVSVLSFPERSICIPLLARGCSESLPTPAGRHPDGRLWKSRSGEGVKSLLLLEGVDTELLEALLDPSAPVESRCMEPLSLLITKPTWERHTFSDTALYSSWSEI